MRVWWWGGVLGANEEESLWMASGLLSCPVTPPLLQADTPGL